jgi:hypothetical protein
VRCVTGMRSGMGNRVDKIGIAIGR